MTWAFEIGQSVMPRPEWRDDPNAIPSGHIVARESWGRDGCYRIAADDRFFAAHVFEVAAMAEHRIDGNAPLFAMVEKT